MPDQIRNWYETLPKDKQPTDPTFKKHYVQPNSMILCIGGTGAGKTNALVDFLHRKDGQFYKIIIYSGSTTDEPLYQMLEKELPGTELYHDIEEVPELTAFDDADKKHQKLIVFDDFINLKTKEMAKINKYLTSGRKFGFTVWCMAQNYTSVPKIVTRNVQYLILFKINDNRSIDTIIRNHNLDGVDPKLFKDLYLRATAQPRNFFMIDLKGGKETRLRHNFLDMLRA
jgi:hypothetical protein